MNIVIMQFSPDSCLFHPLRFPSFVFKAIQSLKHIAKTCIQESGPTLIMLLTMTHGEISREKYDFYSFHCP